MATVAESLIIKLGLDTKDFKKNQQQAQSGLKDTETQANKTGKEMESAGKKGADGIKSITMAITGLAAAVGAARIVKDFFDTAVNGIAALGRSSEYLRMSAKELDGWGGAVESVGGKAEDAQSALQGLSSGIEQFRLTGQSSIAPVLNALGLDLRNFANQADPIGKTALAIADKFKGMAPQTAQFFGQQLGFSPAFVSLLRQGQVPVAQLVAEFTKLSAANAENVRNAEATQLAWAKLDRRFESIKLNLETKLLPILNRLLDRFAKWLDTVDWEKVYQSISRVLGQFVKFVDAIGGWQNVLIGLGALLTLNLLNPLTSIVGAFTSLVPLITSSTGGLLALAAASGALAGTAIWKKFLEGTPAGDAIGKGVSYIAASLGSSSAKEANERDFFSGLSDSEKGKLKAQYLMMSAKDKASYEKEHPGLSGSIKASLSGQRLSELSADQKFYAQHSAIYGDPQKLFAALEDHEGLPSGYLNAYFQQESGGGKNLRSAAGALGPFQFMPNTAAEFGLSGNDVFDLDKSAAAAARKLSGLRRLYGGNDALTAAAYNAGQGNVAKYGGIPPFAETQSYVPAILSRLGMAGTATTSIDNKRSSEVNIQSITVQTQATNANQIATELPGALKRTPLIAQAATGYL